jgi:hypothetical protein
VLTGARSSEVPNPTTLGRVRRITATQGRTTVTVDAADGPHELVLPIEPDRSGAAVAAAGLWRLQWVRLHVDGPVAELGGTTRHPHVRAIPLGAALALAEQGLPAYVVADD